MSRGFIIFLSFLLISCSSTAYKETKDTIIVKSGLGGNVKATKEKYAYFESTGKKVIVDGEIVSADAFYAFSLTNVCYTKNVIWAPHAVSYLGLIPSRKHTEQLTKKLPKELADWFRGNMSYYDWIGFTRVDYKKLKKIWPKGEC